MFYGFLELDSQIHISLPSCFYIRSIKEYCVDKPSVVIEIAMLQNIIREDERKKIVELFFFLLAGQFIWNVEFMFYKSNECHNVVTSIYAIFSSCLSQNVQGLILISITSLLSFDLKTNYYFLLTYDTKFLQNTE